MQEEIIEANQLLEEKIHQRTQEVMLKNTVRTNYNYEMIILTAMLRRKIQALEKEIEYGKQIESQLKLAKENADQAAASKSVC
jgi:hypothetical protein